MEAKTAASEEKMKFRVLISGKVQGVFFRAQTQKKALALGLKGWVRNNRDGQVEAVFAGSKEAVEEMIKWCWQGTPGSKVTSVTSVTSIKSDEKFTTFEIRY